MRPVLRVNEDSNEVFEIPGLDEDVTKLKDKQELVAPGEVLMQESNTSLCNACLLIGGESVSPTPNWKSSLAPAMESPSSPLLEEPTARSDFVPKQRYNLYSAMSAARKQRNSG